MSEFEDDIDDQLLELAGAGDRTERRRKSKSGSRKRKSMDSDSEPEVESEEDAEEEDEASDPYPYEGQYVDEEDKQRLLAMPEIKREEILAERIEEKQRLQEKQVLAQMVRQQRGGGGVVIDDDSVSRAAKRQHMQRGATKEKTRKLDELKAKRRAKDESRKRAKLSPNANRRSTSPQDMDISDEESEDGQFTRSDHEEERERRLLGISTSRSKEEEEEDTTPASLQDFNDCRLSRDMVAKWCLCPWFDEYVKNSWVRYLIGNEGSEPVYRMCEIQGIAPKPVKPYKVNDRLINQAVELKHGQSVREFSMDRISNSDFTQREFDRLVRVCKAEGVTLPTRKELQDKTAQMKKLQDTPLTDQDITFMLKRKKELQSSKSSSELMLERSRLSQARSLALKRLDHKEAAELEDKIAALEAQINGPSGGTASNSPRKAADDRDEVLRRVNERNRRANVESVRRAELAESERRRKEREMAAKAALTGGAGAAAAVATKHDPSARLRTMPRLFNAATPSSRPNTPAANSNSGTPVPKPPPPPGGKTDDASMRPMTANTTMAFEKKLLESIDIDLGDF
ncbi:hypothetical protein CC2G_014939 [Coprinopsis cinerea AmutBmut pab1-1]|nr:hypothetical protein CC2G_014939 [Coprinopsis cinerea AmutBmut pab1-1]